MARQKGIIKLEGSIGDVSFYKSKNGYLAREKGGVDSERIKNDPAYQRTRENGSEFGQAGRAGRIIRTALRPVLKRTADSNVTPRLTKSLIKVLQKDAINVRGQRTVQDGDLSLLLNFEFNEAGKLGATLYAPFQVAVDRAAGTSLITVPAFIPKDTIVYPQGATHMKLISAVSEIDFDADSSTYFSAESDSVQLDSPVEVDPIELAGNFTANTEKAIFLVLGIEFFQEVNGQMYSINNGTYSCLSLVHVEGPVAV